MAAAGAAGTDGGPRRWRGRIGRFGNFGPRPPLTSALTAIYWYRSSGAIDFAIDSTAKRGNLVSRVETQAVRRPTIKDVARAAGVSPSTVSHVLNNSRRVSSDLADRVRAAAATLEYQPNAMARSLRLQTTATLGLVLPDSTNPFFAEVAQAAEETGFRHGYSVIIGNARGDLAVELVQIAALTSRQVDGLILIASTIKATHANDLVGRGMPLVIVDRKMPGVAADVVVSDHFDGALQATAHLLSLGHERIGYIGGPPDLMPSLDRQRGFETALVRAGLQPDPALIRQGDFHAESGYHGALDLMRLPEPPSAIFTANDMMAMGALRALREVKRRVPDDVSIVGFDDIYIARLLAPPLTTVAQPVRRLGEVAVERLLARLEGQAAERPAEIVLPTRLVARESTARRSGA